MTEYTVLDSILVRNTKISGKQGMFVVVFKAKTVYIGFKVNQEDFT